MLKFDWTINVGNVCAILMLFGAVINYSRKILIYLQTMTKKVDIMWDDFIKQHPEMDFL